MKVRAVCVLTNSKRGISGHVLFDELKDRVRITVKVTGLKPNSSHGFHVHRYGDLRDGCDSLCEHYNPHDKTHGGQGDKNRHVGDLGNIVANKNGDVSTVFYDKMIKLTGKYSIIGRSVVIHKGTDDLGKTDHPLSKTTGNSGGRIACGVIGYRS